MVTTEIVGVAAVFAFLLLYVFGSLGMVKRMHDTDYDEPYVPRRPNERGITYLVRGGLYICYQGIIESVLILVALVGIIYKVFSWLFGKPDGGASE